ncbi:MAG: bifunctional protein-serine/threonine kinase/phosphatase, partial [Burkholderiales bacterium]|nr:bifunctional protein-serine/threonine kinase/phosphatase [Burkholderiales bacterium]
LLAALADGVSGNAGGREAAEYSVRGLLSDYYATPDTWSVSQALDKVLQATNKWVQHQGNQRAEVAGMATTLTSVVLRGKFYYFAHVGDSRLYLLRDGRLNCLTTDHVWDRPEMQHVLTRAIGLDRHVVIDHGMGEMQLGDLFILASDGVWAYLPQSEWPRLLQADALNEEQNLADNLVQAALANGGQDNASACVLRVTSLPQENLRDALSSSRSLPLPPRLKVGQNIDGYQIDAILHQSNSSLLYLVTEITPSASEHSRKLVLKTLPPEKNGPHERSAFAHEEWLAKRVVARFFPQVIQPTQKNFLYYLSTWHAGRDLQQMLDEGHHFTVPDIIKLGSNLVRAIGALHRRNIVHRDIKPANLHLGNDEELRVLDLGVARSGLEANDQDDAPQAGTPSFLAPEQFAPHHQGASRQTDVYAAGVTLFYLLTRKYPYGEIEPFQQARFGEPQRPGRYRPDVPQWLENVILKAVAREPSQRFETAEEFLLALERGAAYPLAPPVTPALLQRDPVGVWRAVALIAVIVNILLLYLLVVR